MTDTCPRGHQLTRETTYAKPITGYLECRVCRAENKARSPKPRKPRKPKQPLDEKTLARLRKDVGLPVDGAA